MPETTIVWLRRDLRLADNPALHAAAQRGCVIPVYIDEPRTRWSLGAASRYWLHQSLSAFGAALAARGNRLLIRRGVPRAVLTELVAETGATAVYWNRRYEPDGIACDTALKESLAAACTVRSFNGHLLFEPPRIATAAGTPFRVFTPFSRACLAQDPPPQPLPEPARMAPPPMALSGATLEDLELEPDIDWAAEIRNTWQFGEAAAIARLDDYIEQALAGYALSRDYPAQAGVSCLSPYLAHGEISVRTAWHAVQAAIVAAGVAVEDAARAWLRQLLWREFAYHLLYHFPHSVDAPLREAFAGMAWVEDPHDLRAWTRGMTGFPLVDAGMRELWHTGYMHNRVRMVAASLLCKQLGMNWLAGARWFWDTLVDADLANNTLGWQWVAGCGADAAPYFRIFNPLTQSRKFDADGAYIRNWVAELAALDGDAVHRPPASVMDYPRPLVDLAVAREAALARYAAIKR
ncbi:MAG: deoxyribodipyrimidine photo-lyase [Gammaproteobacteria bacterium]